MAKHSRLKITGKSGHPPLKTSLGVLPSLIEQPTEQRLINKTVMRSEWLDPMDLDPHRRTGRTVVGHRGFCPLRWSLRRHGVRSCFSVEHILAADRLRVLADAIAIGLSGSKDRFNLTFVQFATEPRSGPTRTEVKQARAWQPFRRAMALFNDDERDLLSHIVLLNLATSRYIVVRRSRGVAVREPAIKATLLNCLDRLVEHFRSEIAREIQRGAVI
jgi:hypothetical protein